MTNLVKELTPKEKVMQEKSEQQNYENVAQDNIRRNINTLILVYDKFQDNSRSEIKDEAMRKILDCLKALKITV